MPKKKEPTGTTPVTKESTKSTEATKSTTASATAKPATETTSKAAAKATEKPAAPAPATKAAEKPAAAPAPATKATGKPAAPAPAAKATGKPATPAAKPEKAAASAKAAAPVVTVVVAKFDVGHGNNLYIRGEGPGLNWDSGVLMENAGNDVWVWTTNEVREGTVSFKFLINDEGWSTGDNMTAAAGETTTLYPAF